jgi:hypothetical protein
MLGEPSFFTACMMICTVAPGCTPVMRPIGSARILRKGTLHRRNETKMSDSGHMEGPAEAERGKTQTTFLTHMCCRVLQPARTKKIPPPTPGGHEGRLFPPEQRSFTVPERGIANGKWLHGHSWFESPPDIPIYAVSRQLGAGARERE